MPLVQYSIGDGNPQSPPRRLDPRSGVAESRLWPRGCLAHRAMSQGGQDRVLCHVRGVAQHLAPQCLVRKGSGRDRTRGTDKDDAHPQSDGQPGKEDGERKAKDGKGSTENGQCTVADGEPVASGWSAFPAHLLSSAQSDRVDDRPQQDDRVQPQGLVLDIVQVVLQFEQRVPFG